MTGPEDSDNPPTNRNGTLSQALEVEQQILDIELKVQH